MDHNEQRRRRSHAAPVEVWGGIECTVNRVGDAFFHQLDVSGHATRLDDLERFAALGIRAIRYPVLWERTAPDAIERADWAWADERLDRLRSLGVRPIVGLVHHGSGPRHTSLVDPSFPEGLAEYAGAVAARYPWVTDYTPVNEPLTTARFSGLYGHWHPHGRDDHTFLRALVTQCRATALAMQAIRRTNPAARLVQTEDLGKTYSTPALAHQAAFENERRWLSFDLLCGRVDRAHPLWGYLRDSGIGEGELDWFRDNPCPPEIMGVNTYLTSERFLDERIDRYPAEARQQGSPYVDVAAVHVLQHGIAGHRGLLAEAWERYRLPLAITEAHLGCTREEQLRWLLEAWEAACDLRAAGMDIRAVTAWSLLGACDWDSLLTRQAGSYEPGVFDVSGGTPRPTALAALLSDLAHGRQPDHPVLAGAGWWRRPHRFFFGADLDTSGASSRAPQAAGARAVQRRPLLITGAPGALGQAFGRLCEVRGLDYRLLTRQELDIADRGMAREVVDRLQPWAVVNAAGYARVDDAEREPERCFRENRDGPATLAEVCAARHLPLLTFSTDLVFDGAKPSPYVERDPTAPLNVYGRSKAEAERCVLATLQQALVVRSSAFFGPWDEHNALVAALRSISGGEMCEFADDVTVSLTYVPDLVNACLDLLIDEATGIWHLSNSGGLTWAEFVRKAASCAGLDGAKIRGVPSESLRLPAKRPRNSVLVSERGQALGTLDAALARYFAACTVSWRSRARAEDAS
jgi:dTDP-4-dehydrorhamnose reductase